jgi:hypothetical protein
MTVQQAEAILGMPASDNGVNRVAWRRGNAQRYDATPNGAIEYKVENGVIVGVPEGGVFGPLARQAFVQKLADESAARRAASEAYEEAEAVKKAASDKAEAVRREREEAQTKDEIAAQSKAREQANVICGDKNTCAKVFSLAQIYITQHAD